MADHTAKSKYVKASFAALFAVSLVVLGCETPSPVQVEGPAQPVLVGETPGVDGDIRVQSEHGISANPLVEYKVTAERIDEVLQYLREQGVSRAIRDSGEIRVNLEPILLRLREEGVLRATPPSSDLPLSFLFETRDGAPLGLIRLYEGEGERRVLLFKTIPLPGGN